MCPKGLSLCPWFGQISSVNPIPYTWYDLVRWHTMLSGTLHTLPLIPWYLPSGVVPGCFSDGLLLAPPKLSLSSSEPENCWGGLSWWPANIHACIVASWYVYSSVKQIETSGRVWPYIPTLHRCKVGKSFEKEGMKEHDTSETQNPSTSPNMSLETWSPLRSPNDSSPKMNSPGSISKAKSRSSCSPYTEERGNVAWPIRSLYPIIVGPLHDFVSSI